MTTSQQTQVADVRVGAALFRGKFFHRSAGRPPALPADFDAAEAFKDRQRSPRKPIQVRMLSESPALNAKQAAVQERIREAVRWAERELAKGRS